MAFDALTPGAHAFLALAPTQMSVGAMALGLLGLGALLFALQRLRVRHRSQLVVTTLFWREALEESRARTLFERFRHPLTYLLLALIGGLLWLSVARLESDRGEGVQHTFLLDASAGMAVGDRFARAVDALAAELENTPRERTEVLLCGNGVRTVLAPGEDRALLVARLANAKPVAVPSSVERTLVSAAAQVRGEAGAPHRFVIVGDGPIDPSTSAALSGGDWIERLPLSEAAAQAGDGSSDVSGGVPMEGNVGITALGVSPAASGSFDAVDVMVRVEGQNVSAHRMTISLGGQSVAGAQRRSGANGALEYIIRDLRPASASAAGARLLVAALEASGAANQLDMDDRAEILLPELRLIRVLLSPSGVEAADAALRSACLADGAIEIVNAPARADIVIGGTPAAGLVDLPSLLVASSAGQEHAFEVHDPAVDDPDALLATALGALALDRIDAARLASEIGRPLSLGAASTSGGPRAISVWSELFDPTRSSFTESRAFPVVVGRAARWLSGTPDIIPYRPRGRPQPVRLAGNAAMALYPWEVNDREATLGAPGLLDPGTTLRAGLSAAPSDADRENYPATGGAGPWRFATWVLVLVLALLVSEWILYQRGRIA
ncbi:MAG: hypothetical protein ACI80K_000729 [Paracoccaceae bacterium]